MLFFKKKQKTNSATELKLVTAETPFAIREAFKMLYTNIRYISVESKCKKIAITSAVSGEGKTTLCVNLASTFAQNLEDKRVLVIDTDLRQPKVAKILGMDRKQSGLTEYLAGIDEEPNIVEHKETKLHVRTSGATGLNPTKLISSPRMANLFKKLEEEYDYIFVDTPPVTIVPDAVLMNDYINGYVIACKADYSSINLIDNCIEQLKLVGAEIIGFVLLSLKMKSFSRKSKYSRYYRYNRYNEKYVDDAPKTK
jgi:capsular exopolysaccharide synthesis family protein